MKILAISGSLREQSINSALLRAASEQLSETVEWHAVNFKDLPFYDGATPTGAAAEAVERFRNAIAAADGVLIATPEYNYSVPGGLKNALDWASRPAYESVFRDKPVGVLGAAPGSVGTARAQSHLKQILLGMAAAVFPYPEFALGGAGDKFEQGVLTDAASLARLRSYVADFEAWVSKLSQCPS